ncbi:putative carbonic anhydrase-like protein 2 [Lineus longissimus]|uniref:putative carbonic anhydrase-like protein 2 n=1 Tax=Lineus longissimus TaxID=88925 RepID=UPI002B4D45F6
MYLHAIRSFAVVFLMGFLNQCLGSIWQSWWSYDGISGPHFWGILNTEWHLCEKGRRQSPINIDPKTLLFDTTLGNISIDTNKVRGTLRNTGHYVEFLVDPSLPHAPNITAGPLAYKYRITGFTIHFGSIDFKGSEHTIDRQSFPGEIHIMAYNTDLYQNMSQAIESPNGMTALSILMQIGETSSSQLELLTPAFKAIKYQGQEEEVPSISIHELLPPTNHYITYDGSLPFPGCQETVTWILLNKPVYISRDQISILRQLNRGTEDVPKLSMGNNNRPTQNMNGRGVRTNINVPKPTRLCSVEKEVFYEANIPERL